MRIFLVFLGLIWVASTAYGGAWAREKGQFFVASGVNLWVSDGSEVEMYYDPTVYLEYGATDRVTFGLDYFSTANDTIHTGFAFAQFPLGDVTARDRFAASLAYGARTDFVLEMDQLVRGGLSWGRGLDNGWLAVDVSATYSKNEDIYRPKADFTYGQNLSDHWTLMYQLQTGEDRLDNRYAQIKTGIIYGITDNLRVSLNASKSIKGESPSTVRIAIWQTY